MNKILTLFKLIFISVTVLGQGCVESDFSKLANSKDWKIQFSDECTENWQTKWHLDGLRANVTHNKNGMVLTAGPIEKDNSCHAVLWTKESFKGDIKIEYDYTRTDVLKQNVVMLYIQATGTGKGPYTHDIFEWNDLRIIPAMNMYYNNMNALHISYSAYDRSDPNHEDYIRVRRYPVVTHFKDTEIPEARFNTGLFKPGKTYRITAIRTTGKLYFKVEGQGKSECYEWDTSDFPDVTEGRVGLRHMYTRSAMYKNFKIYTK